MKKILAVFMVLLLIVSLSACFGRPDMPFNGQIEFHAIALTIPEKFIRDSTQSSEDTWIFEHGNYSEYIIVMRSDSESDLEKYAARMRELGAASEVVELSASDAVFTTYYQDGVFCQEILFCHENSTYAIALRGGTESEFDELVGTVALAAPSAEAA